MFRKTLIAGLVFAGLIFLAVRLLRSPEKGQAPAEGKPRPVAKFSKEDLDTLEVIRGGITTVIKKNGDKFNIIKPVSLPAEFNGATLAFNGLLQLEWNYVVTDKKDRHEDFELGANSVRVVAKKGDTVLMDIRVGKTTKLRTLVRLEGKDEVWSVSNFMKYMVDKDTEGWRDNNMIELEENEVEKLTVATKDGAKIVLVRVGKPDAGSHADWRVIESTFPIKGVDKSVPNGIISQLAYWKSNGWADQVTPGETGLDNPEMTITVDLMGGKQRTALFGKKKNDEEVYVRAAHNPQVFLAKNWALEKLYKRPLEFREKIVCDLKPEEITEIAVTYGKNSYVLEKRAEGFALAKPTGVSLTPTRVDLLTKAFTGWKGQSYAEDAKATGLAKPVAVIVVKTGAEERGCQLKVGQVISGKYTQYVDVEGEPAPMITTKSTLDLILLKPEDFKKN